MEDTNSSFAEERAAPQKVSYLLPGVLVTSLFFLWGFSYGLLDTLNKHFRNVLGICKSMEAFSLKYHVFIKFFFQLPQKQLICKSLILVPILFFLFRKLTCYIDGII